MAGRLTSGAFTAPTIRMVRKLWSRFSNSRSRWSTQLCLSPRQLLEAIPDNMSGPGTVYTCLVVGALEIIFDIFPAGLNGLDVHAGTEKGMIKREQ
jgi:hypothetical protein